jgi:hypothetical protein
VVLQTLATQEAARAARPVFQADSLRLFKQPTALSQLLSKLTGFHAKKTRLYVMRLKVMSVSLLPLASIAHSKVHGVETRLTSVVTQKTSTV